MTVSAHFSFLPLCMVLFHSSFSEARTRYPQGVKPPQFEFDVFNIKTPQMIGIVFGMLVFSLTIMSVAMLLYKSGTLSRFLSEIQSGTPLKISQLGSAASTIPQTSTQPELYDHLISATHSLPLTPSMPLLKGKLIHLREYCAGTDLCALHEVGSGRACFHESAFSPQRVFGWLPDFAPALASQSESEFEFIEKAALGSCLERVSGSQHFVVLDPTLGRAIGMLSLVDNCTRDLTIRIDNLWLTPAYQGLKWAHEAVLLTLEHLVALGYRRVTAEVDARHLIARKFLERCGFKLEGILRKHRIVNKRNRDTALFVFLNSDWQEVSVRLKALLGIDLKPKAKKLADVDRPENLFGAGTAKKRARRRRQKK